MSKTTPTAKQPAQKEPTEKFSKEVLDGVIRRLESGESRLIEESTKLVNRPDNNPLRAALRALLGTAEYRKMIERSMAARKPQPPQKPEPKKAAAKRTKKSKPAKAAE